MLNIKQNEKIYWITHACMQEVKIICSFSCKYCNTCGSVSKEYYSVSTVGGAYHNIWMIIIWYIEYHTTSIGHNFTAYYEIQLRPFLTITISLSFSRSFNWHVHFAENHICLKLYSLWYQYLDMDPFIKWAYKSNYSVLTHEKILQGLPVPVGSVS